MCALFGISQSYVCLFSNSQLNVFIMAIATVCFPGVYYGIVFGAFPQIFVIQV